MQRPSTIDEVPQHILIYTRPPEVSHNSKLNVGLLGGSSGWQRAMKNTLSSLDISAVSQFNFSVP